MPSRSQSRELLFTINDVARLLRTHADQYARRIGMTRAQWAVLLQLERREGRKQTELAEVLDIKPITLTRLVDRLCRGGLIERRADRSDRRAKLLYLTPAARPLIETIADRVEDLAVTVLDGIGAEGVERMLGQLNLTRENVKAAIQRTAAQEPTKDVAPAKPRERVKRYG